jgi:hypothetical protein
MIFGNDNKGPLNSFKYLEVLRKLQIVFSVMDADHKKNQWWKSNNTNPSKNHTARRKILPGLVWPPLIDTEQRKMEFIQCNQWHVIRKEKNEKKINWISTRKTQNYDFSRNTNAEKSLIHRYKKAYQRKKEYTK